MGTVLRVGRPFKQRGLTRWRHPFSHALGRRRGLAAFARHALQDVLAARGPTAAQTGTAGAPAEADLLRLARATPSQALDLLRSRPQGLNPREVAARRRRHGPNTVGHAGPPAWPLHLWHCFRDPFNLLLSALALLSAFTDGPRSAVVILAIVALATGLRFVQEHRSQSAAQRLGALVANTARVRRQGRELGLPLAQLVPGDVVHLSAGDMVPADARLLEAIDLFVAQSALTGESMPVLKAAVSRPEEAAGGPLEQPGLVFMGTSVISGTATALVVATGDRAHFGAIARHLQQASASPDTLRQGLDGIGHLLVRFAAVLVPAVLLVNGLSRGDWVQALLFAVSVAVGLTPEMLPMVVSSTLAAGAIALSRRQLVVKRLDAIHEMGAMDVLCTDKTGTLTLDQVVLERHVDVLGRPSARVLDLAMLNSHWQTGLRNLLDRAVLAHADRVQATRLTTDWRKLGEIPFDFERRRMSVVVARDDGPALLVCKGALEEVLAACTRVLPAPDEPGHAPGHEADATALTPPLRERVMSTAQSLHDEGLRLVAVAVREWPHAPDRFRSEDESALTLVGFCAFLDPPKPSAAPALAALAGHGVAVKVLTGDHERVALRTCERVGLRAPTLLTGSALAALPVPERAATVQRTQVFARLTPLQKEEVVRLLRAQGHVVGFLGDGINDAPALRAADVGISVDGAADIAREAADVILLEKDLRVLDEGVTTGRATFCNLLKYIRMAASSNFGNVLSVAVASAALPFLPMLPLQLLVQNLLYDLSQTAIPFDRVDAEQVRAPLRWDPAQVRRFMLSFGPASSLMDVAAFAALWWGLGAADASRQALFHTGWFVIGLLTQTLVVHLIRTPGWPTLQTTAAPALWLATLSVAGLGLWLPMGPLAPLLGLEPLPPLFFAWLLLILAAYAGLVSLAKRLYVVRWGWP